MESRPLLRAPEVAQMLGLSRAKVYELMASGQLPTRRIGRSVRVVASKLDAWIQGDDGALTPTAGSDTRGGRSHNGAAKRKTVGRLQGRSNKKRR